jgi:hypothetical protein
MQAHTSDARILHQEDLTVIQRNWDLDPSTIHTAIPEGLEPNPNASRWPHNLIEALRCLSELTIGQMDRAHSLLKTYFRARIRCNSYKIKQGQLHAELEVVDVQDAIRSLKLMNRGQAMEDASKSSFVANVRPHPKAATMEQGNKRKFRSEDEYRMRAGSLPGQLHQLPSYPDVSYREKYLHTDLPTISIDNDLSLSPDTHPISREGVSKRLKSVPNIRIPTSHSYTLAAPSPFKTPARSPIYALLNFPLSPALSPSLLPPLSALFQGTETTLDQEKNSLTTPDSEEFRLHALKRELPTPSEPQPQSKKLNSPYDNLNIGSNSSQEESPELRMRRLELEEAQTALEVARQKHIVATNKATIARLEIRRTEVSKGPRSA